MNICIHSFCITGMTKPHVHGLLIYASFVGQVYMSKIQLDSHYLVRHFAKIYWHGAKTPACVDLAHTRVNKAIKKHVGVNFSDKGNNDIRSANESFNHYVWVVFPINTFHIWR